jgi:hypothetical protein
VIPETILKGMKVKYTIPRVAVQEIPVAERRTTFKEEVSQPLDPSLARKEASRCLRCGLTCYDGEAGAEYAADPDVKPLDAED